MKTKRNLSGIYFREKNNKGKFENVTFEDLPEKRQDEILEKNSHDWTKSLVKALSSVINDLGDQFDIVNS